MGVLDDAIRQHLELKRQHGADESELRQKEDEALGPARRESPAPDEDVQAEEAVPGDEQAEPLEAEPAPSDPTDPFDGDQPFADDPVATEPEPLEAEPIVEPEPFPDEPPLEPEPVIEDEVVDEPPLADPPLEGHPPAGEENEDVLEETPDFLQETPEHDRLWFEQKPPRDFDFDDE